MKRLFYFFLLIFAFFWLETGLRRVFPGNNFIPQLVLILLVVFSIRVNFQELLATILFGGLLGELFSGLYFGAAIWSMLICVPLARFAWSNPTLRSFSLSHIWFIGLIATAAYPLAAYLYSLVISGLGFMSRPMFFNFYSLEILWQIIANLCLIYAVYWLVKFIFHE